MTQLFSNRNSKQIQSPHRALNVSLSLVLLLLFGGSANAQNYYVSGIVGLNNPANSANSGELTSNFTTGDVAGFSPPVTLPAGTALSWDTDLSNGETYSLAFGYRFDSYRLELALNRSSNKVGNHSNILLGGNSLSGVDAGVLRTGNVGGIGNRTDSFLSNGGSFDTTAVMLNAYYDFNWSGDLHPYLGVGIGNAEEEVSFTSISGDILRAEQNDLAWQLIAGFEYVVDNNISFFGQYRYFEADEPNFGLVILPANLDLENQFQAFEMGLRFSF